MDIGLVCETSDGTGFVFIGVLLVTPISGDVVIGMIGSVKQKPHQESTISLDNDVEP